MKKTLSLTIALVMLAAAGDYRIREGAGFPDIRLEEIGRY